MKKFIAHINNWWHCIVNVHRPLYDKCSSGSNLYEEKIGCADCGFVSYYYENYP